MQLGLLGLLLGAQQAAPAAGQLSGGAADDGKGGARDIFSALLSDAGAESGQHQGGAASEWVATQQGASSLLAQELGGTPSQSNLNALADLLNQKITPQDADALLKQLAELAPSLGAEQQSLLTQMQAALTQIKDGTDSVTLGALIAQLPDVQKAEGADVQLAAQTAAPTGNNITAPVVVSPAHQALHVIKDLLIALKTPSTKAADAINGNTDSAVAPTQTHDALAQSLQASIFPDDSAAASAQQKDDKKSRDYVEIVPLSAEVSTAPAWVKNIEKAAPRADIDQAIPSLKLAQDTSLPEVNLPQVGKGADDAAAKAALPEEMKSFSDILGNKGVAQSGDDSKLNAAHLHDSTQAPLTGVQSPSAIAPATNAASINANNHGLVNHAPVVEQVQVAITRSHSDGINHVTIQLEPGDLGRVEVQMHTQSDGQTHISFTVDKPQTMDSLSRDVHSLERSLQESGIKADAGNMQFNLRQQPQAMMQQGGNNQFGSGRPQWDDEEENAKVVPQAAAISAATQNYTLTLRDGVDIRA